MYLKTTLSYECLEKVNGLLRYFQLNHKWFQLDIVKQIGNVGSMFSWETLSRSQSILKLTSLFNTVNYL